MNTARATLWLKNRMPGEISCASLCYPQFGRWLLRLGLVAFLALRATAVQGQECPPDCRPMSTTSWAILSVVTAGEEATEKSGRVNALWVDAGQALWAGTDVGLSRYDGHAWQTHPNPESPASNRIRCLTGDGAGGVWAGTSAGLSHFDGRAWRATLTTADGLPDNLVTSIAPDGAGGLWVGTLRGLAHFDGQQVDLRVNQVNGQSLDEIGSVAALLPDQAGGVFSAVGNQVIHVSRQGATQQYGAAAGLDIQRRVQALTTTADGHLWAGTGAGLYRFDGTAFEAIPLADDADVQSPDVISMATDGGDGLWLGTPQGLWHFDGQRIVQRFTAREGLAADPVLVISRTDDGTLWLGTVDGMISRGNPIAWRTFPAAGSNFYAVRGANGRLWATSDEGLATWDGQRWQQVVAGQAMGLWLADGAVWFGTAAGLQRLDATDRPPVLVDSLDGQLSRAIAGDAAGSLWVGTRAGLFHLRKGMAPEHYDRTTGLAHNRINALLPDPVANTVWVGTDGGVSWRTGDAWASVTWEGSFALKTVRILAWGSDGSIWAGTDAGLRRLPPHASASDPTAWELYESRNIVDPEQPKLAQGDRVNALWVDEATNQLWVGTDAGLWGLHDNGTLDQDDDVWASLVAQDGLVSNRVTTLWRDVEGKLWIGTARGLIRHVPIAQPPVITADDILTNDAPLGAEIPWQQTDVRFRFEGSSLVTERLFYRYQLLSDDEGDPIGDEWRVFRPGQQVDLTPGNGYRLTVQAFDPDLNASPPASAAFVVEAVPPLARQEIQVILVLLTAGSIGVAIVLGPGRRWWRAYKRPAYRETWEIDFIQTRADLPVFTAYARQRYARDLRLIVEGRAGHLFSQEGESIAANPELPDDLLSLHEAWRSATDADDLAAKLDDLAHSLGTALLPQKLATMAQALREAAARRGYYVRLRLNFAEAPALAIWPWEVSQPAGLEPLGANAVTAVSRWLPRPRASGETEEDTPPAVMPPLARDHTLRVLLVVASPTDVDLPPLDGGSELRRLQEALDGLRAEVRVLAGVGAGGPETEYDTREALALELEAGADVVHFIGHAGPHPRPPQDIVLYGEDRYGDLYGLGAADLAEVIAASQERGSGPRLVVLNACRTAEADGREALAGLVPELIVKTGLMAVVGMQYPVGDGAAVFTSTFYPALVRTQLVDFAVSLARETMKREAKGRDWAAPVLYMQVADGMIYEP
ncbi:MAG: CHAT domain-containing protein [Anaerolineae bacterium]|nr:MAG: CHAT domain-containing protein [Anaerolineae bacterium]